MLQQIHPASCQMHNVKSESLARNLSSDTQECYIWSFSSRESNDPKLSRQQQGTSPSFKHSTPLLASLMLIYSYIIGASPTSKTSKWSTRSLPHPSLHSFASKPLANLLMHHRSKPNLEGLQVVYTLITTLLLITSLFTTSFLTISLDHILLDNIALPHRFLPHPSEAHRFTTSLPIMAARCPVAQYLVFYEPVASYHDALYPIALTLWLIILSRIALSFSTWSLITLTPSTISLVTKSLVTMSL